MGQKQLSDFCSFFSYADIIILEYFYLETASISKSLWLDKRKCRLFMYTVSSNRDEASIEREAGIRYGGKIHRQ